jgi:hypothetical protein
MNLPDARGHDDGIEYCGLLYQGTDDRFHASAPSRLPPKIRIELSRAYKTCSIPLRVNDPSGVRAVEADFHSHSWPDSPLTPVFDTASRNQRYSIRIQLDTTCHVFKLVPHVNEPIPPRSSNGWAAPGA